MWLLEDHPDLGPWREHCFACYEHLAFERPLEAGHRIQERGLAAAGWTDDRDEFPLSYRQGYAVDRDDLSARHIEDDAQILDPDDRLARRGGRRVRIHEPERLVWTKQARGHRHHTARSARIAKERSATKESSPRAANPPMT
jgi:hypothetical protein